MKIEITEKNYGMLLAIVSGLYEVRLHITELVIHGHTIKLPYKEVLPLDQWNFTKFVMNTLNTAKSDNSLL